MVKSKFNLQLLDKAWGEWGLWSPCSISCEGGQQTRTRLCNNIGGQPCPGEDSQLQTCNTQPCDAKGIYY
jgi:hemicentin